MPRKPSVQTKCVASQYGAATERIVEFSDPNTGKGGLISIRPLDNGNLAVDVYRCDPGVIVNGIEVKP